MAVDSSGYWLSWSGTTWTTAASLDSGHSLTSVSCVPTVGFSCDAVDGSGRAFLYRSGSWGAAHTVTSTHALTGVSCFRFVQTGAGVNACVAITNNGKNDLNVGSSWFPPGTVAAGKDLQSVSCKGTSTTTFSCAYTDNAGNAYWDTPSTISHSNVDGSHDVDSVSCPIASSCTVVDTSGNAVTTRSGSGTGSAVWSTTSPPTQADATGLVTTTSYAPGGAIASVTNPAGVTTYTYNTAGNKKKTTYSTHASTYTVPHNVSWTYDQAGLPTSMTDGTGKTTYGYDGAGDLTAKALTTHASGLSNESMGFTYVSAGQLKTVTYPSYSGHTNPKATYTYNTEGEMTSVKDWNAHKISFRYDHDGNIIHQGNALTTAQPTGTSTTAFKYDASDALLTVATTYKGHTTSITPALPPPPSTCTPTSYTHGYSMTPSKGGSRNADEQVSTYVVWNKTSCRSTPTLGGATHLTYDLASRVTSGKSTTGSQYGYDTAGNLTKYTDKFGGTNVTLTQTVDAAGEVTAQTGSSHSATFTYNTLGNRKSMTRTSVVTNYTYSQMGEMLSAGPSSARSTYQYDGDGNEAGYKSQGASGWEQFVWAGAIGSMTLLYSDGADYFIYGPGTTPVEQFNVTASPPSSNPTYLNYAFGDGHSTDTVTNTAGYVLDPKQYQVYGQTTYVATKGTVFGFAGQYSDITGTSPSGLVNMRARWYAPTTGTFMSVDPTVATTDRPYTYAGDDPVNQTDPSGECTGGNITCWLNNERWYLDAEGTGSTGHPLSGKQAGGFLVDNNFTSADAAKYTESFVGQIYINITSNLLLPIFRYYGGTGKQGLFFADTYFPCASDARSAYHLVPSITSNTASYVAQVAPNYDFDQAPLVLEGHVAGGNPSVLQYMVFDPNEFVYGPGVKTDSGTYPPRPPISVGLIGGGEGGGEAE